MIDSVKNGKTIILAICVVLLIQELGDELKKNTLPKPYYGNFTDKNFREKIVNGLRVPTNHPDLCKEAGYLTVHTGGRLGNLLGYYARLYGNARRYNLKPVIELKAHTRLTRLFQHPSIPAFDKTKLNCSYPFKCNTKDPGCSFEEYAPSVRNGSTNMYFYGWRGSTSIEEFDEYKKDLLETEFALESTLKKAAETFISRVKIKHRNRIENLKQPFNLVGVHVRRTDYTYFLNKAYSYGGHYGSKQYYLDAMDYFRARFENVIFIIASDDQTWCRKHLAAVDVEFSHTNDLPVEIESAIDFDMALLSSLDHSILSFGSFSFWIAYLRGDGMTIWYENQADLLKPKLNSTTSTWISMADPCSTMLNGKKVLKNETNCE